MNVIWILTTIWTAAFVLFITIYFGYFFLVFLLARLKGKKPKKAEDFTPFISILIPCYNVGSVIDYKIKNTLEIDYPKDKFEIRAVESGSTDDTYVKLSKYAKQGKVKLIRQIKRSGKSSAINKGLEECRGKIILLTDADAKVEKNAIRELVRNFADPEVGAVVADMIIVSGKTLASKMNHLFYHYLRRKPRIWESELDSVSFCSGHLLAFYKSVVERMDEDILNDDRYILLKTRSKGYRCVCEPLSNAYEADTGTFLSQIAQKRRTTAGTIQGTVRFKSLLFNPRYGFFGMFILPFHLLRVVFLPFLLLSLEILSPIVFWTLLSFHWIFWAVIAVTIILTCLSEPLRKIFLSFSYGIIVQIAAFTGIMDYAFKRYSPLWMRVGSPWDEMAWETQSSKNHTK
jgi:biofilm PGA synthesis N-glycosyltransferase PgaC